MSENEQSFTIAVPTTEPHTVVQTQHGMQFPNGRIIWDTMSVGGGRYVDFTSLANVKVSTNRKYWDEYLKEKAQIALVDLGDYTAQHTLVKRTLILVTTGVEEVEPASDEVVPPQWDL